MRPDIEKIKARAEKATPGPWGICLGSGLNVCTWVRYENPENGQITFVADCLPDDALDCAEQDHRPNMDFIAHARTDIPALLDYIDKLEAEKKMMRERLAFAKCALLCGEQLTLEGEAFIDEALKREE
jgi:hypothetical protein